MSHVVSRPAAPFAVGAVQIHQVPAATDNLVWVIVGGGEAAIVDGPDASGALALCEGLGVRPVAVLNTHTHGDHVGVNRDLARRGLLDGMRVIGPARAASDVPGLTEPVDEGDGVEVCGVRLSVWLTEGHLNGHVSYVLDADDGGAVFCGDTLFAGGCGFLFDGPPEAMYRSLLRLASLPPATRVCCAHEYTEDNLGFARFVEPGNPALAARFDAVRALRAEGGCAVPSTIAEERATNPFLRPGSPELIARLRELGPLASDDPLAVFTAARALKNTGAHKAR